MVNIFPVLKNVLVMKDDGLVVLDVEAQNGKPYKLGFPLGEAMKLLHLLLDVQQKTGASLPDTPVQFTDVPPKDRAN
jgi:hypothetical protein